MLNWIKWKIAPKEMEELERWQVYWRQQRQWLSEFPDVATSLDNLYEEAIGRNPLPVSLLRDRMRHGTFRAEASKQKDSK